MKHLTIKHIAILFWSFSMKHDIAVIGAGPMGLAVAYQLAQDGYRPIIFEADDRIGGQAASFSFDGLEIERFYHFHCTSDKAFLKTLEELNLKKKMRWTETKMGYYYQENVQPWGNPFALLKFSGLNLFSKIRYGLHVFLATRRKNWKSLDQLESTVWLKRWVGKEAYKVLWEKLFELKFYNYAKSTSAAWTWSRIRRIGRSRYSIFREKLGYLEGGSDTLLQAMREYIEKKGGEFYLACPVEKIMIENGETKGILSRRGFESFEKVISTIPLPYLPDILKDLPEDILTLYKGIDNVAVVCVVAKLAKPVTQNFWLNINDPNMDIPGIVEYSNLRSFEKHIVYAPYYMPAVYPKFKQSDQAFQNEFKEYLKKINPSLKDDDFLAMHVSRYQYAQPVCTPGFLEKLPPVKLPVKGLWAADTSYYYPEDRGISESIKFGRKMARDAVRNTQN
jgi:protoporphyrinogen oxidase